MAALIVLCKNCTGWQARDPTVHAAIIAHLNQKYGSGSAADENALDRNLQVSCYFMQHLLSTLGNHSGWLNELCWCVQGLPSLKDKDITKGTSDLSEDLFKVHDFDVKIDLQVPTAGEACCLSWNGYRDDTRWMWWIADFNSFLLPVTQRPSLCR